MKFSNWRAFGVAAVAYMAAWSSNPATSEAAGKVDLAGAWRFQIDPDDVGLTGKWFGSELQDNIKLPGVLQAQGFGENIGIDTQWTGSLNDRSFFDNPLFEKYRQPDNFKVPFCLQPPRHYVGVAWYQREIEIPESWDGASTSLELERCHWQSTAWIDDIQIGSHDSLSVPHRYPLPANLAPGRHRLTLRIDNRVKIGVGSNAHSITDHTQTNWNGVVGYLRLASTRGSVQIVEVNVVPDVDTKSAKVTLKLKAMKPGHHSGHLTLDAVPRGQVEHDPAPQKVAYDFDGTDDEVVVQYDMGDDAQTWDEFHPSVYTLRTEVREIAEGDVMDVIEEPLALREIATKGTQITINGRPVFLRGALECNIFPLTGHPPTDVDSWRHVFGTAKAYGLNHIRFHSHCPPEAAFMAADEMGIYLQVEVASWVNQGSEFGQGKEIDRWIYEETDRILREYGNHPSFVMLSSGNEPGGNGAAEFLTKYVARYKTDDGTRLVTGAAGWPEMPINDFQVFQQPRLQQWGEGTKSRINSTPPSTTDDFRAIVSKRAQPIISHEIGQWVVWPNLEEIKKYTGYLRAGNLEVFADLLSRQNLYNQARDFLMASGKLQLLFYKEEIETALRTPGFGGFQLLGLQDFPGQGSAIVGVVDPFWDPKPYCTPEEYSQFCNAIVPLARLPKRVMESTEELSGTIELAHFGPRDLSDVTTTWKIVNAANETLDEGCISTISIATGKLARIGNFTATLEKAGAVPQQARLVVRVESPDLPQPRTNDWNLWIYPPQPATEFGDDALVSHQLDDKTEQALAAGKTVVLLPTATQVNTKLVLAFSPIFWSSSWTNQAPPHTLGLLCDPAHPLFKHFPTSYHTDWQWWELVSTAATLELDKLPTRIQPLVQIVPDYFNPQLLAMVFEAKVGPGRLIVCSADIESDLDNRIAARQFRSSLAAYLASDDFQPSIELSFDEVQTLLRP